MSDEKTDELIRRTGRFHAEVHTHVGNLVPFAGKRYLVAFQANLLSLEHASGALLLISEGFFPSAYALMRPQYECLVRGVWLLYAATDGWVDKLGEPLTLENAARADDGKLLAETLKNLDACAEAPKALIEQLKQYRDVTWKALNSYAHAGLHPISRTMTGYPPELTFDVLRNSNAVVTISAQLAAILSGDPEAMKSVRRFHADYADCLPLCGE